MFNAAGGGAGQEQMVVLDWSRWWCWTGADGGAGQEQMVVLWSPHPLIELLNLHSG